MNARAVFLALVIAGCSTPVTLVVPPDAPVSDGGPGLPHCEVTGETWTDLGSPLETVGLLPPLSQPVAIAPDGTVAVASLRGVRVDTSGRFEALPTTGLPDTVRVTALTWHDGGWWIGTDGAPGASVYRFDGAAWLERGRPTEGGITQLLSMGTTLVAHAFIDVALLTDAAASAWTVVPRASDEFVSDVVVGRRGLYVLFRGVTGRLAWSADGSDFEDLPLGDTSSLGDLAAGGGLVVAAGGLGFSSGYELLDERDPAPSFRHVPLADGAPAPVWLGEDGSVIHRSVGVDTYVSDGLEGPLFPMNDVLPPFTSTGVNVVFFVAGDASSFVVPVAVTGGTRMVRSRDHGRTYAPVARLASPATALELSSDGTTAVVRVLDDLGSWRSYASRSGAWDEVVLPDLTLEGVTGLPGLLITRTSEYGDVPPHVSRDGGRTFEPLAAGYPGYDTNAGSALRVASDFALDDRGRVLVATVGGVTSICCTGTKVGWDYRSGAGIWRWDGAWTPLNAGIPIESGPDGFGGPPFRSDIDAVSASDAGVFAVLRGRGVYRLAADRWQPHGAGLPLDGSVGLTSVRDASGRSRALAYGSSGLYREESGLWVPLAGEASSVAARVDLLVRADGATLSASSDAGDHWAPLPAAEGEARWLALTDDALYAVFADHHTRTLAVECTEGE